MSARIYSPAKNAMQSGKAKAHTWILEFDREAPRTIEPLMGYTSCRDTRSQIHLKFPTLEAAKTYCENHGIAYQVNPNHSAKRRKIAYADNFSCNRSLPWTH